MVKLSIPRSFDLQELESVMLVYMIHEHNEQANILPEIIYLLHQSYKRITKQLKQLQ